MTFFVADRLKDKVFVVTGAASGIGRACAIRYAAEGGKVVLADIADDAGEAAAAAIREAGGDAAYVSADMADQAAIAGLAASALDRFGRIDVWHNNAYWSAFKPIDEQSPEEFEKTIAVSLSSYWLGAKLAVTHMKKRGGRGLILNTASVHSFLGHKSFSAYQVAKGGVLSLTRSLAVDHGPDIRAVAIAPGLIATPANDTLSPDLLKDILARIPAGRAAAPEEVAGLAAYLASDEADYISGTAMIIDGGYLSIG